MRTRGEEPNAILDRTGVGLGLTPVSPWSAFNCGDARKQTPPRTIICRGARPDAARWLGPRHPQNDAARHSRRLDYVADCPRSSASALPTLMQVPTIMSAKRWACMSLQPACALISGLRDCQTCSANGGAAWNWAAEMSVLLHGEHVKADPTRILDPARLDETADRHLINPAGRSALWLAGRSERTR